MNQLSGSPEEWLTILFYLAFAAFIAWKVLQTQSKE